MGVVRIGQTEVAYELQRSAAASERRITVTPGYVEVLALTTDDDAEIAAFLTRKRQWLFNALRELEAQTSSRSIVRRFMTGSKIPYRGRHVKLTVRRHDGAHVEINFRRGFLVDLPHWVSLDNSDRIVATELKLWLKRAVRRDVELLVTRYRDRFNLRPRVVRVAELDHAWGSCGIRKGLTINWTLVFAPRPVLDYVVAHELAHLVEHHHGPAFWRLLEQIQPEYGAAKAWLDRHQGQLDASFLEV